jgi:hypothetical protein
LSEAHSRGTAGVGKDITYDAAGERLTMTLTNGSTDTKETYIYTADGYLNRFFERIWRSRRPLD